MRSASILVCEDNYFIRELLVDFLGQDGYLVQAAANAEIAQVLLLSEGPFDVLVTDLQMPGKIDGAELARWTKENLPGLRIVGTTAWYDQIEKVINRFDAFYMKPYNLSDISNCISRFLSGENRAANQTG